MVKESNLGVIGVPEGREGESSRKYKEIMAENFPNTEIETYKFM